MKQSNIKIAFLGTPQFAATILEEMIQAGIIINSVYTKPDSLSGRNKILHFSKVKEVALKHNLPIFQPNNKIELEKQVCDEKPDLLIVAAYGIILTQKTLDIPKFGVLNVHGSLLPKFRGPSPVSAAILEGEGSTGITIIKLTAGMDEGPILNVSPYELEIGKTDTTESLLTKIAKLGSKAIIEVIPKYLSNELEITEQNHSKATYCKMIKKSDGIIDFNKTAKQINREVRAYLPWPKSQLTYQDSKYNILDATPSDKKVPQGSLTIIDGKLILGLKKSSLEILKIQPEGKNIMSARDFINGNKNKLFKNL